MTAPNEDYRDMQLWFVDDRQANHEMWLNSFSAEVRECCEFRSFYSVPEIIAEFTAGHLPDVVFIDFFVGGQLGVEVIRWFAGHDARPVLIAHSSMNEANQGMVAEGADFLLEKIKDRPFTESIRQVFSSFDDIAHIIQARSPRHIP